MKRLIAFVSFVVVSLPAFAQETPPSFADLVEKLSPAVVNISTTQTVKNPPMMFGLPFEHMPNSPQMEPFRDFFERFNQDMGRRAPEREVTSLGSGFVIDAKGYVITNNHVVKQADDITVIFADNGKYKATLVGSDPKTDLALLKIDAKKNFPFVKMGDSDAMRVGDWVVAIGNPFGLGGSVTKGIISARARSINAGPFDDFLQTDAPINRGNSGGPLFNLQGEVIGINTAIFSPSGGSVGIGFAIPTALAKPVIDQIKTKGHVTRGWLGVKIQEVSEEVADSVGLKKPMGALVLEVGKDTPADKAGIMSGDIITHFDGKAVTEMRFLPRMVAEAKINTTVPVALWRKNAAKTVKLQVGKLEEENEEASIRGSKKDQSKASRPGAQSLMGLELIPLNAQLRAQLKLSNNVKGLVVLDVDSGSEAAKRGVREGDVITQVNSEPVASVADMKKGFASAKKAGRKYALVRVSRSGSEAFITLPVAEEK
ncbi:MAG: DegQ family serine endoprotease [Rickettsiales bacterium]